MTSWVGRHERRRARIFDLRAFKSTGVDQMDVAKRLIDVVVRAPTVSFPSDHGGEPNPTRLIDADAEWLLDWVVVPIVVAPA